MTAVVRRARLVGQLLRTQGPGWLAFRAGHALRRRCGALRRRLPLTSWDEHPLGALLRAPKLAAPDDYLAYRRDEAPPFLFDPALTRDPSIFRRWDEGRQDGPEARSDELRRGVVRYFGHGPVAVGFPPPWHTNPLTGQPVPADRHWTEVDDFAHGDIKMIWEPGRFGFAFDLVRADARSGDGAHAELFWRLVEDWRDRNPPQRGPHWKCGQEVALRCLAWCFGLYGFLGSPATTPGRVAGLSRMVAVSARRIEATLSYALSQNNNHGISEAAGLWTIGALFPELRGAERWAETGRRVLESLGRTLIDDDGGFAQHSFNYQRLMLHAYVWSLRLGDARGRPFSDALRARVGRAGDLLAQLQDETTGRVPNYGHNDGALVLPLNNCEYEDFRPVLQSVGYLATGTRRYPDGPWDEDLFWLFGPSAVGAKVERPDRADLRAGIGGYHTLRSPTGFAFVRAARFRHRPAHADMLHIDLWWRGQNVALDAGTYSYNAPPPWDNALAATAVHNTVTVDGLSQMDRAGRFLWLPWCRSEERLRRTSASGHLAYWEGVHDGYGRLRPPVAHRRAVVRLGDEHWLIVDDLRSRGAHRYRLHWLLPDWPLDPQGQDVSNDRRPSPPHPDLLPQGADRRSPLSPCGRGVGGEGTLTRCPTARSGPDHPSPPAPLPQWERGDKAFNPLPTSCGGRPEWIVMLKSPAGPYGVRAGAWPGPASASLVRAESDGVRGWRSPHYMRREPALSLDLTQNMADARFWTVFGPSGFTATADERGVAVATASWSVRAGWGAGEGSPVLARVDMTGVSEGSLELTR